MSTFEEYPQTGSNEENYEQQENNYEEQNYDQQEYEQQNFEQQNEGEDQKQDSSLPSAGEKRAREDDAQGYKRQRIDVSNRKIMIKSLSFDCRREALYDIFIKYGQIEELKFPTFKDSGRSKGFAFIIYSDPESAQKSLEANSTILGDRQIEVQMAVEKNPYSGTTKEIFVGSLPFEATEQDVRTFFEKYGTVVDVRLPVGHSKRQKGFGYISFASTDDVKEALNANGAEFMGRTIRVNEEVHQERRRPAGWRPYPPRDGGYNRYDGGYHRMGDRFGGDRFGGDRFGGDRFGGRRGGRFGGDRRGGRFGGDRFGDRMGDRYGDRGDWKRRM